MIIKCKDDEGKTLYVRSYDMSRGELTFTENRDEAGRWDSWNAEMARDWFRHHYKDKYPMIVNSELRDRD